MYGACIGHSQFHSICSPFCLPAIGGVLRWYESCSKNPTKLSKWTSLSLSFSLSFHLSYETSNFDNPKELIESFHCTKCHSYAKSHILSHCFENVSLSLVKINYSKLHDWEKMMRKKDERNMNTKHNIRTVYLVSLLDTIDFEST